MTDTAVKGRTHREFLLWATPRLVIVVGTLVAALTAFATRYSLMIDPQAAPCIPGKHLFLVDKKDRVPERGAIYAMRAEGIAPLLEVAHPATNVMRPFYRDGQPLIKVMDGMPGDRLTVEEAQVLVNGERQASGGLMLSGTLMRPASTFESTYTLSKDRYFMAGRTNNSFDSRYWGPISSAQIIGRVYPLL
jgi:conjugal transfer pilin signal peptidase TrbI